MATKVDCPHCDARLRIRDARLGSQVRCPACGEAFKSNRPVSLPQVAGGHGGSPDAGHALFDSEEENAPRSERRSPLSLGDMQIPTLFAGVFALGTTIVLAFLVRGLIPDSFVARLFSHGLISFFTALLGVWALCILVLKTRWLATEKRSLHFDVLSQEEDEVIRPSNVNRFLAHIQRLPAKFRETILFRRISKALECFRSTGSPSGVSTYLASQNDLSAGASESSYTMVRAFIWAVPILGFIGTVFGIGEAVNSFAVSVDSAEDVEAIRTSLGGVTGGLGTAFETTLVALVMSILLMIPTNWLQKTEDDLLTSIGSYCNEELVWRFEQAGGVAPTGSTVSTAAPDSASMNAALRSAVEQAEALGTTLEASVATVKQGLDDTAEKLGEGLPRAITDLHEKVEQSFELSSQMLEAQQGMRERFAVAAEAESVESLMLKVNETHGRMLDVFERMAQIKPRRWWRLWR